MNAGAAFPPNEPAAEERSALCFDVDAGAQMERPVVDLGRMYRERNEALREVVQAHHDALSARTSRFRTAS